MNQTPSPPSSVTKNVPAEDTPHYHGHRQRLKDKFLNHSASLSDYELLELLLCLVVPRRDMKPLAKMLLGEFASLTHILNADEHRLKSLKGVGDSVILALKLVHVFHQKMMGDDCRTQPLMSARDIIQHCKQRIGFHSTEHILVLFLDNQQRLIHDAIMHQGTVDRSTLYPREILKKALALSASSLIISHNHPGGDTTPSPQDIHMTHNLMAAADALGVAILDHIIVSDRAHTSLRQMGFMDGG